MATTPGSQATKDNVQPSVFTLLRFCKAKRVSALITVAQKFIGECERQAWNRNEALKKALRCFFKAAQGAGAGESAGRTGGAGEIAIRKPAGGWESGGTRPANPAEGAAYAPPRNAVPPVPPVAAEDMGKMDWEQDLSRASRVAVFRWRTEQTYRGWAARFAAFLAPVSPYRATEVEVAAFLTELAVRQRASRSTQQQALNALVFLMQAALHRQLGRIEFWRAAPLDRG